MQGGRATLQIVGHAGGLGHVKRWLLFAALLSFLALAAVRWARLSESASA